MQELAYITALSLAIIGSALAAPQNLTGEEARAVAVAVDAFSHDASLSWKHVHAYRIHVGTSGRLLRIEFEPTIPHFEILHGKRNDIFVIHPIRRSAEYLIKPSTGQIVRRS